MQQTVRSVTGAALVIEMCDLSGQQLTLVDGPYAGQEVEVLGITDFSIAKLAIRLADRNMAINPIWAMIDPDSL